MCGSPRPPACTRIPRQARSSSPVPALRRPSPGHRPGPRPDLRSLMTTSNEPTKADQRPRGSRLGDRLRGAGGHPALRPPARRPAAHRLRDVGPGPGLRRQAPRRWSSTSTPTAVMAMTIKDVWDQLRGQRVRGVGKRRELQPRRSPRARRLLPPDRPLQGRVPRRSRASSARSSSRPCSPQARRSGALSGDAAKQLHDRDGGEGGLTRGPEHLLRRHRPRQGVLDVLEDLQVVGLALGRLVRFGKSTAGLVGITSLTTAAVGFVKVGADYSGR
jgi:hypothetical protein